MHRWAAEAELQPCCLDGCCRAALGNAVGVPAVRRRGVVPGGSSVKLAAGPATLFRSCHSSYFLSWVWYQHDEPWRVSPRLQTKALFSRGGELKWDGPLHGAFKGCSPVRGCLSGGQPGSSTKLGCAQRQAVARNCGPLAAGTEQLGSTRTQKGTPKEMRGAAALEREKQ